MLISANDSVETGIWYSWDTDIRSKSSAHSIKLSPSYQTVITFYWRHKGEKFYAILCKPKFWQNFNLKWSIFEFLKRKFIFLNLFLSNFSWPVSLISTIISNQYKISNYIQIYKHLLSSIVYKVLWSSWQSFWLN